MENRDTKYLYKGVVFKPHDDTSGDISIGVLYGEQIYFMTISDIEKKYTHLKENEFGILVVEFQDGTEPTDFMYAQEKDFEDIFISIQDLVVIELTDIHVSMEIHDNPKEMIPTFIIEVYETFQDPVIIDRIKKFNDYTEEWANS